MRLRERMGIMGRDIMHEIPRQLQIHISNLLFACLAGWNECLANYMEIVFMRTSLNVARWDPLGRTTLLRIQGRQLRCVLSISHKLSHEMSVACDGIVCQGSFQG